MREEVQDPVRKELVLGPLTILAESHQQNAQLRRPGETGPSDLRRPLTVEPTGKKAGGFDPIRQRGRGAGPCRNKRLVPEQPTRLDQTVRRVAEDVRARGVVEVRA